MGRPLPRTIFTSYAVAWLYLAGFIAAEVVYAALSPHDQAAVLGWASTNVHNLRHHPAAPWWPPRSLPRPSHPGPPLIALAMFGANRVLGNWRTALVCAAGQVTGTLVSEAIVGYRVSRGLLPAADDHHRRRPLVRGRVRDRGGPAVRLWLARAAAALDLALLVVVGNIFGGLSDLDIVAVGHVTAMPVAAVGGSLLLWQLRRRQRRPLRQDRAGAPLASPQSRTKIR